MGTIEKEGTTTTARPAWHDLRVMTFAGQHDTHKSTGEEYRTATLRQMFEFEPTHASKGRGWAIIPSAYHEYDGRNHARQRESGEFTALCGDIDKGDNPLAAVRTAVEAIARGSAWLIYSSAHSRPGNRRWRIMLPLAHPVPFEDWHDAQIAFFEHMEERGLQMDVALARAGQPVYLPNVPDKHEGSGTVLRGEDGAPLYFQRQHSDMDRPGFSLQSDLIADRIRVLREKRRVDEAERQRIQREGVAKRKRRPISRGNDESLIDAFNRDNSLADLFSHYGYKQSPVSSIDWRSPFQQGDTYATRIVEGKWISLSTSDVDAGLGEACAAGCFGDAYDLFVHFEHAGSHQDAFRALGFQAQASAPPFQDRPPPNDGDGVDPHPSEEAEASNPKAGAQGFASDVEPIDLWARYEPPKLQRGLLPEAVDEIAFRMADIMGVDPAGLAMAILAVCGAAITDDICVQVKTYESGWRESARLWVGMIGPPSRKKSPIMKFAMRPLAKADSVLMSAYMIEKEDYDLLTPKERKSATKPKMKRYVVSDATIETLQEILQGSTGGVISEQDELSGWFGSMDKYANGKGQQADRAFYLKAFNGGRYTVDRIARGSKLIPNLSMSMVGGIQPDPIRKIMAETVDDGLIQRLIPIILAPANTGKDIPSFEIEQKYARLIEHLLTMKPEREAVSKYDMDAPRKRALRFSPEAKAVREQLEREHLDLVRALEFNSPKLASHFGKYDAIFARLCVIWHCVNNLQGIHPPREIAASTAEKVAKFMTDFIRPSAIAFYVGMLRFSDGHDELQTIASFIVARGFTEVVPRDVSKASQTLKSYDADEIRRLFERLENFGWLEPAPSRPKSSKPCWRVNPAVHRLYAERGRQEADRRERSQKALQSALSSSSCP